MATTLMRTPKSAVSVAADLSIVRLYFTDAEISHFHVVFFFPFREVPMSSDQSLPLPK